MKEAMIPNELRFKGPKGKAKMEKTGGVQKTYTSGAVNYGIQKSQTIEGKGTTGGEARMHTHAAPKCKRSGKTKSPSINR